MEISWNIRLHETSHLFPSSTSLRIAASPGDAALGADGPQPTQRDAARARHQRGRGPGIEFPQNSSLKIFLPKKCRWKKQVKVFFCKFFDVIVWKWEIINCESLYEHCMTIFLLRWNGWSMKLPGWCVWQRGNVPGGFWMDRHRRGAGECDWICAATTPGEGDDLVFESEVCQ